MQESTLRQRLQEQDPYSSPWTYKVYRIVSIRCLGLRLVNSYCTIRHQNAGLCINCLYFHRFCLFSSDWTWYFAGLFIFAVTTAIQQPITDLEQVRRKYFHTALFKNRLDDIFCNNSGFRLQTFTVIKWKVSENGIKEFLKITSVKESLSSLNLTKF